MTSEQQATSSERVKEIMAAEIREEGQMDGVTALEASEYATAAIKALEAAGFVIVPVGRKGVDNDLRALVERIRAAIDYTDPPEQAVFDEMVRRSIIDQGLSLRATAKKHGTTVGKVRGALARLAAIKAAGE